MNTFPQKYFLYIFATKIGIVRGISVKLLKINRLNKIKRMSEK